MAAGKGTDFLKGFVGDIFDGAVNIFSASQRNATEAKIAESNAQAVSGVVKFLGVVASIVFVFTFLFKIFK